MENRTVNIRELPLTIMGGTLQNLKYQNLSTDQACEEVVRHIGVVKKSSDIFVLLWHNSVLDTRSGWLGWREVYERAMEYIGAEKAWVASEREIIDWW